MLSTQLLGKRKKRLQRAIGALRVSGPRPVLYRGPLSTSYHLSKIDEKQWGLLLVVLLGNLLSARIGQHPGAPERALGKAAAKHDHAVVHAVETAIVPTGSCNWYLGRKR
jgi:hypothetical protein